MHRFSEFLAVVSLSIFTTRRYYARPIRPCEMEPLLLQVLFLIFKLQYVSVVFNTSVNQTLYGKLERCQALLANVVYGVVKVRDL